MIHQSVSELMHGGQITCVCPVQGSWLPGAISSTAGVCCIAVFQGRVAGKQKMNGSSFSLGKDMLLSVTGYSVC